MIDFGKYNIQTNGRTSGRMKTFCPQCHDSRKNKRDKSLSVNLDTGLAYCHYCNWTCNAKAAEKRPFVPFVAPPQPAVLKDEHVRWFVEKRGIPASILMEAGITSADEFLPQTGKKESCICFNYFEGHTLVNTKYRDMNKNFKLIAGAELIPYNLNGILGQPECIITEGEIDALSFMTIGRKDVISVPGGANRNLTWMDRFMESHFEDKRVIYLCTDTDRKGIELRNELLRRLGAERCRIIDLALSKDANELLLVEHGAEALQAALAAAPESPLEGIFTTEDTADGLRILFESGLGHGADTGLANFDSSCTFELGRLCVVSGIPGCGKSEFVDELVVRLNLKHHWKAAFFSPENMPIVYHQQKLVEKLTGRRFSKESLPETLFHAAADYMAQNFFSILPEENYTAENILLKARQLVHRKGIRIFVIDPFNRLEHQIPPGMNETQYISSFLDRISNFAQRNRCLVILVAHPRKMNREPGSLKKAVPDLYDINGSAAFYNKCDFGLIVERDHENSFTHIRIEKVKFKHLGQKGVATFKYNYLNGRFIECEIDNNHQITNSASYDNSSWLHEEPKIQLTINTDAS